MLASLRVRCRGCCSSVSSAGSYRLAILLLAVIATCAGALSASAAAPARRPNVVLIISDDQGYGDLGCHGNPVIKTPNLDRLAGQGVELASFYVSPVCTPTRAALMTGRYNYRTCAIDTFSGRALMSPEEVTLPQMLRSGGYRTGIFGKWHLGDNYPLRAIDRGFDEALTLWGGGLCQPADPPEGNSYFDPTLSHNGQNIKTQGYITDILTSAALGFIEQHAAGKPHGAEPFFVYLPYNCPHDPLEVDAAAAKRYADQDLSPGVFPQVGNPIAPAYLQKLDTTAKIYAMVENIDMNVGRVMAKLDELRLADNTIVIFMTDNGPQQPRYNAGLRAQKGTVYEGGIHVPCLVRLPGQLTAGRKATPVTAHIDLAPTLLAACGVAQPAAVRFDGVNLWPLLSGQVESLPERHYFAQWHRGDAPERYRACTVRGPRYKLVQAAGMQEKPAAFTPKFELFDLLADPYEQRDLASEQPAVVAELKAAYDRWFDDVSSTRGYAPPRIHLGSSHQNPVLLTRQDRRGAGRDGFSPTSVGHWEVEVERAGRYEIAVLMPPQPQAGTVTLKFQQRVYTQPLAAGAERAVFTLSDFPAGPGALEPSVTRADQITGVTYVQVKRVEGN